MQNGKVRILPQMLGENSVIKISKKNRKKHDSINLTRNCDIVKHKSDYYLHITVDINLNVQKSNSKKIAGVDPGIRTFATVYTHAKNGNKISEYTHRRDLLQRYNDKLDLLKLFQYNPKTLKRIRKSKYSASKRIRMTM